MARDFKTYANFLLDHGLHPGDIRFTYIQDIYDLQKISPDWHVLVFLEGWQETRRSGDAAILYESAARWLGKRTVNLDILLDPGVMRSD